MKDQVKYLVVSSLWSSWNYNQLIFCNQLQWTGLQAHWKKVSEFWVILTELLSNDKTKASLGRRNKSSVQNVKWLVRELHYLKGGGWQRNTSWICCNWMAKPGDMFLKCASRSIMFRIWDYYHLPQAVILKWITSLTWSFTLRKTQVTWNFGEQSKNTVISDSSYLHVTGFYSQKKI